MKFFSNPANILRVLIVILLAVFLFMYFGGHFPNSPKNSGNNISPSSNFLGLQINQPHVLAPHVAENTDEAIPFPGHGVVRNTSFDEAIAIFGVETQNDGNYVYILLRNIENGNRISVTLEPNSKFETLIPLGEYEAFYTAGHYWFGYERLFGKNSVVEKAVDNLLFYQDDDSIMGLTIILEGAINGNMPTINVPLSEITD